MTLDEAKNRLSSGKGSIRCKEVKTILENLGFEIESGKVPNHYQFNHPALDGWWGSNFSCPHGGGDPVRKGHISKILRVMKEHEAALKIYLGETND